MNTDRMRNKDLRCEWVIPCVMLHDLMLNPETDDESTPEVYSAVCDQMTMLVAEPTEFESVGQRRDNNEDRLKMTETTQSFSDAIAEALHAMNTVADNVHSGRQIKATVKILNDPICKRLLTDQRVKEFITEPFMQNTTQNMEKRGHFDRK